jgi:hypothetical protein
MKLSFEYYEKEKESIFNQKIELDRVKNRISNMIDIYLKLNSDRFNINGDYIRCVYFYFNFNKELVINYLLKINGTTIDSEIILNEDELLILSKFLEDEDLYINIDKFNL